MAKLRKNIPQKSYSGERWVTNSTNKKYLAQDFKNRCCYCDDHHSYSGGYDSYHVEHFAPKSKFDHLKFTYDNLLYSCPFCNISKGNKWIGTTANENIDLNLGVGFVNPCTTDYDLHLYRKSNGEIFYKTQIGKYMHKELKLYLDRHKIIYKLSQVRSIEKKLSKIITQKNSQGKNCDREQKLHYEVLIEFIKYFDEIFPEN